MAEGKNESAVHTTDTLADIADRVEAVVSELAVLGSLQAGQIIVFGTSTSEVLGKRIGTAGTEEVAKHIFEGIRRVRGKVGFFPAFQCCEHLNRALVVEKELLSRYPELEPVSVVPVPRAGGSMAAYAYRAWKDPVVVETIQAHAGVDIGGTLIGMHLRRVAIPVRPSVRTVGQAWVQAAYTRPKLIGGERAVYRLEQEQDLNGCT